MLSSQLEIVQQAKEFLSNISVLDYTTPILPHFPGVQERICVMLLTIIWH